MEFVLENKDLCLFQSFRRIENINVYSFFLVKFIYKLQFFIAISRLFEFRYLKLVVKQTRGGPALMTLTFSSIQS